MQKYSNTYKLRHNNGRDVNHSVGEKQCSAKALRTRYLPYCIYFMIDDKICITTYI